MSDIQTAIEEYINERICEAIADADIDDKIQTAIEYADIDDKIENKIKERFRRLIHGNKENQQ